MDKMLKRRIELRDRVLRYFNKSEGRSVRGMSTNSTFAGYEHDEITDMRLALAQAGLILLISGTGNGAHYQTTDDGVIFLEAIKHYAIIE